MKHFDVYGEVAMPSRVKERVNAVLVREWVRVKGLIMLHGVAN